MTGKGGTLGLKGEVSGRDGREDAVGYSRRCSLLAVVDRVVYGGCNPY